MPCFKELNVIGLCPLDSLERNQPESPRQQYWEAAPRGGTAWGDGGYEVEPGEARPGEKRHVDHQPL